MPPPSGPRDPIAGPSTPQPPYPIKLRGPVIKGFGRGSKELGIPTANIPLSGLSIGGHDDLASGIYYGFASLDHSTTQTSSSNDPSAPTAPSKSSNHAVADLETSASSSSTSSATPTNPTNPTPHPTVYPTVLSIGHNPYYANTHRSIEIHLLHTFPADFYGATLSLMMLGFIRPEYDYVSKEALVEDIREDIRVARRSLEREGYVRWKADAWLLGEGGAAEGEVRGGDGEVVGGQMEREEGVGQKDGVGVSQMMA